MDCILIQASCVLRYTSGMELAALFGYPLVVSAFQHRRAHVCIAQVIWYGNRTSRNNKKKHLAVQHSHLILSTLEMLLTGC